MKLPDVTILSTGGTIASRYDPETGAASVVASGEDLVSSVPMLATIASVSVKSVFKKASFQIDSSDILLLAQAVRSELSKSNVTGVVITHGTDTMEESAFLLSLIVDTGHKPVVFTGAQLSGDMEGADGSRNLINAVRVAGDGAAQGIGVVIAFADSVLSAHDATKSHTSRLETFVSSRGARMGELYRDTIQIYAPAFKRPTYAVSNLAVDVPLIYLAMGMGLDLFDYVLKRGAQGVIIAAFGIGNATPAICDGVARATDRGIPVIVTSRCSSGAVTPVYTDGGGKDLEAAGAIFGADLSPIKARLALMVLLSCDYDINMVRKELMLIAA